MTVVAALKNAVGVVTMLVLPCAMLLLLIWGLSRLFGLLGLGKWSENTRVALALAVVVGFLTLQRQRSLTTRLTSNPDFTYRPLKRRSEETAHACANRDYISLRA
jgi:hypothetical protein